MKNLFLAVSAITVLVLFGISFKNSLSVTLDGARATAVCTAVEQSARRSGRAARRSRRFRKYSFRYTDQQGQEHSASIQYRMFWQNPEVGEWVPILYPRSSPALIYYDSVFHVWMYPAILGLLLTAMGVKRLARLRPPAEREPAT